VNNIQLKYDKALVFHFNFVKSDFLQVAVILTKGLLLGVLPFCEWTG